MISVVIPAFNEEKGLPATIAEVRAALGPDAEILVVDDGSTDGTAAAASGSGARVLRHPINLGYGRSLKDGIAAAAHDVVAIIDADRTYPAEALPSMVRMVREDGFDMVVGDRRGGASGDSLHKKLARWVFKRLCTFASGTRIPDVNSGLRVFRKSITEPFWNAFSTGYSFTTTLTLLSLLHGYLVTWVPIQCRPREGRSKVRFLRDSLRAAQILVEAILAYNPTKVFLLLFASVFLFGAATWALGTFLWAPLVSFGPISVAASFVILAVGFGVSALRKRPSGGTPR